MLVLLVMIELLLCNECNVLWSDDHNDIGFIIKLVSWVNSVLLYHNLAISHSFIYAYESIMQVKVYPICSRSNLIYLRYFDHNLSYRTPNNAKLVGLVQKFSHSVTVKNSQELDTTSGRYIQISELLRICKTV